MHEGVRIVKIREVSEHACAPESCAWGVRNEMRSFVRPLATPASTQANLHPRSARSLYVAAHSRFKYIPKPRTLVHLAPRYIALASCKVEVFATSGHCTAPATGHGVQQTHDRSAHPLLKRNSRISSSSQRSHPELRRGAITAADVRRTARP